MWKKEKWGTSLTLTLISFCNFPIGIFVSLWGKKEEVCSADSAKSLKEGA
jgi:hypothetical protein